MIWFLEKGSESIACEVRRGPNGTYEYEVTVPGGESRLQQYDRATAFLEGYLREQSELRRLGWRPRMIDIGF